MIDVEIVCDVVVFVGVVFVIRVGVSVFAGVDVDVVVCFDVDFLGVVN